MERKSGVPAYLTALIPGVGYMYLGLRRKGIQALILFLLISPVFRLIGLSFLIDLVKWPLWFYTFFDTINLASRMDKGEFIPDSDFLFLSKFNETGDFGKNTRLNSNGLWYLAGWALVVLGALAILNKIFINSDIYGYIRNIISVYFIPVLLVLTGVYLLMRNKKNL